LEDRLDGVSVTVRLPELASVEVAAKSGMPASKLVATPKPRDANTEQDEQGGREPEFGE